MKNTTNDGTREKHPEVFTPDIFTRYKISEHQKKSEQDALPSEKSDLTIPCEGETESNHSRKDTVETSSSKKQ